MNREDIIRMAQEAGGFLGEVPRGDAWMFAEEEYLERFAALVASAERERLTDAAMKSAEKAVEVAMALEREACAKLCEEEADDEMYLGLHYAEAIRARGNVATNDTSQERVDETTKQRHD